MTDYISYVFGSVVVVGGIIGFAKAGENVIVSCISRDI